jgi:hypothetical protein
MQVFTADIWQEVLEDTKGVLYIHKSKMVRQHNGQKKEDKITQTMIYKSP